MKSTQRQALLAIAALVGAILYWRTPPAIAPVLPWAFIATVILAAASVIPIINRQLVKTLDRIQNQLRAHRARCGWVIAIVSSIYLSFTAHQQDRDFFPKTLDDQSYVIQMRMLAGGKLWMSQHPCADFFDTFHMLARPVYASAYFPGTALLYIPLIWLGAPIWLGPILVAGGIVGMMYRVISELVDAVAGFIAAMLTLSSTWFRTYSILVYGQPIALLVGLLAVWTWLRWRETLRWKWPAIIGLFGGFLVITRPADAVCYGLPIGIAMLFIGRKGQQSERSNTSMHNSRYRAVLLSILLVIVGAAPFLAIQLIQNVGITGSPIRTPFAAYIDRDQPGANFGFHPYNPSLQPASVLPQKQVYYQQFIVPFIQKHTLSQAGRWLKEHLPQIVDTTLPARVMLLFIPTGLLGLKRDLRRWVLIGTFPLFLLVYFGYPPFVEHYALPYAPAVILCVAMAPNVLRESLPRRGHLIFPAAIIVILIVSISMLPELNGKVDDETFRSPMMRVLHDRVDNSDLAPAVILFRYHPELPQTGDNSCKIEPVYNTDVAWPDDAPIIRAHDLGDRNIELFRYYASRQPQRTFYLFDRGNLADPMHRLGTAAELANAGR